MQNHQDNKDAFAVFYLDIIKNQVDRWFDNLPRVKPFYAVKCNPDPVVLETLFNAGIEGFDCASMQEIQSVMKLPGLNPSQHVIYANCIKEESHLHFAKSAGVQYFTFDNSDEIRKMAAIGRGTFKGILRIAPDDSTAVCRLSNKFGADLEHLPELFETAKEVGLDIVGVSFHVGSGCQDEVAYYDAVKLARAAFDVGAQYGFKDSMKILDVGGGYPGTLGKFGKITFEGIARQLNRAFDEMFPASEGIQLIAEPGRFFVYACVTLYSNIIGRRKLKTGGYMYYVNDGVYGSFNCLLFDHATVYPVKAPEQYVALSTRRCTKGSNPVFDSESDSDEEMLTCSLWGPTCDGLDCISKAVKLPEMEIGEWIMCENMGSYTIAAASNFNGFKLVNRVYI